MPRIALLVGRHLHYIEDYARYPGANERGIAEIRTRQGLKQEAVGLPGGSAYDQGDDYRHDGARDRLRHRLRQSDANGSPRQIP